MRRNIASLAARIMAEDGIADYGFAKRKAARQLGAPDTEELPTNAEIEIELRTYQSLYQADEQEARLDELRASALEVMRLLRDFSPYLTGPVLNGTAGRYATIELQLFAESAKTVEIFLLDRGIDCDHVAPRRTGPEAPETILCLDWDDVPVEIAVFSQNMERSQRRNPHSGKVEERISLALAESLFEKGGA
jgi:hypothetical protein